MLMFVLYQKMHLNQRETYLLESFDPDTTYTNNQIVVNVPNVRKPIPLFILMRALGVISDKAIIETCLLNLDENSDYIDFFIPSVHDANRFFTQKAAIEYIATLTKGKQSPCV